MTAVCVYLALCGGLEVLTCVWLSCWTTAGFLALRVSGFLGFPVWILLVGVWGCLT